MKFLRGVFLYLVVLFWGAAPAYAIIADLGGSTANWTAITYGESQQTDYYVDQQTGHAASDVIGSTPTGEQAGVYKQYWDAGTGDIADDYIGFRVRLAEADLEGQAISWQANLLLGIDVGADGDADVFVIVDGKGDTIGFYEVGTGGNYSPATTTVEPLVGTEYTQALTSDNYNYSAVSATTDHIYAGGGGSNNLDGATTQGDDTDYFLSFQIDMATLMAAVTASSGETLDADTELAFLFGTSIQDNAFNQDLNGQNGDSKTGGGDPYSKEFENLTWEELGAASDAYTASGDTPVPEPSAYALIFGVLVGSLVCVRRRRS